MRATDVDDDGIPDLVVTGVQRDGNGELQWLHGTGSGDFAAPHFLTSAWALLGIAFADFNGDGHTDLATIMNYDSRVVVMLGQGHGQFGLPEWYPVDSGMGLPAIPWFLTAVDINRDGASDLVTANINSSTMSVLAGDGHGSFAMAEVHDTGVGPGGSTSAAIADYDGDGNLDYIGAYQDGFRLLAGHGDGTFDPPLQFKTGDNNSGWTAAADLNGDQLPDLLITDVQHTAIVCLLNQHR